MPPTIMRTLAFMACMLQCVMATKITYPECNGGQGCCTFGAGKMRSPGYVVVKMEFDTIVTCYNEKLECFRGNPNLRASQEGRDQVPCPDFAAAMEKRDTEYATIDGAFKGNGVVRPVNIE